MGVGLRIMSQNQNLLAHVDISCTVKLGITMAIRKYCLEKNLKYVIVH